MGWRQDAHRLQAKQSATATRHSPHHRQPPHLVLQAVARAAALARAPPPLPGVVPHRLQRLLDPAQLRDRAGVWRRRGF